MARPRGGSRSSPGTFSRLHLTVECPTEFGQTVHVSGSSILAGLRYPSLVRRECFVWLHQDNLDGLVAVGRVTLPSSTSFKFALAAPLRPTRNHMVTVCLHTRYSTNNQDAGHLLSRWRTDNHVCPLRKDSHKSTMPDRGVSAVR